MTTTLTTVFVVFVVLGVIVGVVAARRLARRASRLTMPPARHHPPGGSPRRLPRIVTLAATAVAAAVGVDSAGIAADVPPADAIAAWAEQHATPVETTPGASTTDLLPLGEAADGAVIVGLGESAHGVREEILLKHRTLRFLVEELGFRTVAWEEDWTTGVEIDDYITGGPGDADELVRMMSPQYRFAEVADVLRWLREFNTGLADPVRFFGVEMYLTRQLAYDTVESYVASADPRQLGTARRHLAAIEPTSEDPFEHIGWYSQEEDKEMYIDHAQAVRDIVEGVAHEADDREHQAAVHAAGQIVGFYEHYRLAPADQPNFRDAHAADSLRWWQQLTGHQVVYWAAVAHTADAPAVRITRPPEADLRFASVGSHLRRWYGDDYLSVGFTFDHGSVSAGEQGTIELPPPDAGWFEHPLGSVDEQTFLLDLGAEAPPPVDRWLEAAARTRGMPDAGPGSFIDGGTVGEWFDVIVHRDAVTPATPAA